MKVTCFVCVGGGFYVHVLVDKHKRIRDVSISEMNDTEKEKGE